MDMEGTSMDQGMHRVERVHRVVMME
jgi:hypothetical protein